MGGRGEDFGTKVDPRYVGQGQGGMHGLENPTPGIDNGMTDRPPADPWQHREVGMRCRSCMWFVVKLSLRKSLDPKGDLGRCRRHAPTLGGYPAVFEGDWCGDHKLDESKT